MTHPSKVHHSVVLLYSESGLGCCLVSKSCRTLCDPTGCNPPGPSVHWISQRRILEGLPFPSPGDLPHPGIKSTSPSLAGGFFTTVPPGKPVVVFTTLILGNVHQPGTKAQILFFFFFFQIFTIKLYILYWSIAN